MTAFAMGISTRPIEGLLRVIRPEDGPDHSTIGRSVANAKRQGIDARGVARAARAAWGKAIASLERTERLESAWGRCRAALELWLMYEEWCEVLGQAWLAGIVGPLA